MTDTETKLADALRKLLAAKWCTHEYHVAATASIRALDAYDTARAQPASVPGGWVVVPSAPTSAMVEACVKLKLDRLKGFMEGDYEPKDVRQSTVEDWLAMLAAAPQPAKEADR